MQRRARSESCSLGGARIRGNSRVETTTVVSLEATFVTRMTGNGSRLGSVRSLVGCDASEIVETSQQQLASIDVAGVRSFEDFALDGQQHDERITLSVRHRYSARANAIPGSMTASTSRESTARRTTRKP